MTESSPIIEKKQTPGFSSEKRAEFFTSLSQNKEGPLEKIDSNDFLRFVGVPNEIIIKELESVSMEERLQKAISMGIVEEVDGKSWSYATDRPIVLTKVGGETVPFYRSKQGTGGAKKAGIWYPFFGIGHDFWLIKGGNDNFENCYSNPVLKKIQDILSETFNWDHSLDLQKGTLADFHPLASNTENLERYFKRTELNKIAFNNEEIKDISIGSDESNKQITNVLSGMIERFPIEVLQEIKKTNQKTLKDMGYIDANTN